MSTSAPDDATFPLPHPLPMPRRIRENDVAVIEYAVEQLRALDHRHGGGACRPAVRRYLTQARLMLTEVTDETLLGRLCVALADLHNLAGWTSFDLGLVAEAHRHLDRALELAKVTRAHDLAANVRYRKGRVHLHHGSPADALFEFTTGRLDAARAHSPLALAILSANQAWAHARMSERDEALSRMAQAEDEFAQSQVDTAPPWAAFFDANDLTAMAGTVHTELAQTVDGCYARSAVPAVRRAIDGYGDDMARSRAFNLISLSVDLLLLGERDEAVAVGERALQESKAVHSTRTKDRMAPLIEQLGGHTDDPATRDLLERVTAFVREGAGSDQSFGG